MTNKNRIEDQDNALFSIKYNSGLNCYDLTLKKAAYDTTSELIGIIGWLHQLGVHRPKIQIRIGAMLAESPKTDSNENAVN